MMKHLHATVAGIALIASLSVMTGPAMAAKVDDGGIRTSKIDPSDPVKERVAHAYTAPAIGDAKVSVSETFTFLHPHSFWNPFGHDVKYKIQVTTSANWVSELNQWMLRDDEGGFIAFHEGQKPGQVIAKPVIELGERSSAISTDDSNEIAKLGAGNISSNGNFRTINVTHRYKHEETYLDRAYTIRASFSAQWVPEQRAHMGWYQNQLYSVRMGSTDVRHLSSKAYSDLGTRFNKMDWNDNQINVSVAPYTLTSDGYNVLLRVTRTYRHEDQFQRLDYDIIDTAMATYNSSWKVWTAIIDGRVYAVAFDNEVVNDGNVVILNAPGNLHRPKVIVVDPHGNGNSGGPVVVVPKKPTDGPVVIDEDGNSGNSGGPVVVVPKKPGSGSSVHTAPTHSGGPAVVIPGKPRD